MGHGTREGRHQKGKKELEERNQQGGKQQTHLQRIVTRKDWIQTSENDVSKSLISIFTFIKELYNSIIVQIPAPISKDAWSRKER